jgi:hypothetical protein
MNKTKKSPYELSGPSIAEKVQKQEQKQLKKWAKKFDNCYPSRKDKK